MMYEYSPEVAEIMARWEREQEEREKEFYAKRQQEREEQAARLAGRPSALTLTLALRRKRALNEALRRRMGPSGYLTTAIMGRR